MLVCIQAIDFTVAGGRGTAVFTYAFMPVFLFYIHPRQRKCVCLCVCVCVFALVYITYIINDYAAE